MRFQRPGRIWIPEAPNIILARARDAYVDHVPSPMFEGYFNIKLIDSRTGDVRRELNFKNLITDAALDYIGAVNGVFACLANAQMGTGGTAPTVSDTTLQTPIGTRVIKDGGFPQVGSGPSFAYWRAVYQYTFLEANANGNLAEIGLFSAATSGTMWTRQILKDVGGTPTTITKTSAERLQVTYEVRCYSPTADVSGTINISGTNYDYTVRASEIDNTNWQGNVTNFCAGTTGVASTTETAALGALTGAPPGITGFGGTTSTSQGIDTYTNGTFRRDHSYIFETTTSNYATGLGALIFGNYSSGNSWQIAFTSLKIPKTALNRLTLITRHSWGRYP